MRPSAWSPRKVMQVLDAFATNRSASSKTSHSAREIVRPPFVILPTARSLPVHTGRRKLIFSSKVVELSPSFSVLWWAIPMAESATVHKTPP